MLNFESWLGTVPIYTKSYMIGIFVITLLSAFSKTMIKYLYFDVNLVVFELEIWRILTCFLYFGPLGFYLFYYIKLVTKFGPAFENIPMFVNDRPSFFWCIIFMILCLLIHAGLNKSYFLGPDFILTVICVLCKYEDQTVFSMFGFDIHGAKLPYFLGMIRLLIGEDMLSILVCISIGEIYFLLREIIPKRYRKINLMTPPQFFTEFIDKILTPQNNNPAFTGRGNRLG